MKRSLSAVSPVALDMLWGLHPKVPFYKQVQNKAALRAQPLSTRVGCHYAVDYITEPSPFIDVIR